MFSTIFATRTIVILGLALLIGSPALARNDKVQVCHVPPGNPENAQEISVSANAAEAHLGNHEGDALGPCPEPVVCPCWAEEDLLGAVDAANASDDVRVSFCNLYMETGDVDEIYFGAGLAFAAELGYVIGYVWGQDKGPEDEAECMVEGEDLDVGLEPIELEDISIEEASECARVIGEICPDLLP
jgi:hypothetical protein